MSNILLVGLGNPGREYQHNRHNVGFMFVDYLAKNETWKNDKYLLSESTQYEPSGTPQHWILAKPQTFMNKSGEAVKKLSVKYQQPDTNFLYVIHDDLDIPIGKFKIQKGTGPKVHNGLSSINDHLHTEDYWRIRIGVENRDPTNRIPGEDYVLHDFTYDEQKILDELFPQILQRLQENIRVNK